MSGGFQTSVTTLPALGVAGDFASANPYFSYDAGPGGLVAGANGLTVGRFAWVAPYPLDADNAGQVANNNGIGQVAGFVHRSQRALITTYLADASMVVPAGLDVSLMTGGDFLMKNDGTADALMGQKAYADLATGKVTFAATASPTAGATSTAASIAAGSASVTGSISGNILTVSTIGSGKLVVGATIAGSAGSAGGVAVATGTQIVSQLTGGTSGSVGTYTVSIGEQNVTSTTITETYGTLTVGGSLTGTLAVGQSIAGTDGTTTTSATTTWITALGTGAGGSGTYIVNKTQTLNSTSITAYGNVETKWIAMSSGAPGELVKTSSHPLG
jgi:hypothetical protein